MRQRDPYYTSVCTVCWRQTWYADKAIILPSDSDRHVTPFETKPEAWEYGNRAHLHGRPEGTHNLRMIDRSSLAPQFAHYYETGERIKVEFVGNDGEVYETLTGTVGKTTGWRPSYLLMRRITDSGSVYTLGKSDRVVAVKRGRKYLQVRF